MSKIKFWQLMAMWTIMEQEKEQETLRQNPDSRFPQVSRQRKHSRSLGQHRYIYLSKRSR